jgi:hypothetical protein
MEISLSIAPGLLERVNAVANHRDISRTALLIVWIKNRLEQERQ